MHSRHFRQQIKCIFRFCRRRLASEQLSKPSSSAASEPACALASLISAFRSCARVVLATALQARPILSHAAAEYIAISREHVLRYSFVHMELGMNFNTVDRPLNGIILRYHLVLTACRLFHYLASLAIQLTLHTCIVRMDFAVSSTSSDQSIFHNLLGS